MASPHTEPSIWVYCLKKLNRIKREKDEFLSLFIRQEVNEILLTIQKNLKDEAQ
jgi:hypothetical protein